MFTVTVVLEIDPKDTAAFEEGLMQHAANSRGQEGCVTFSVARNHSQAGRYHIWEVYRDKDAFQAHVDADFMAWWREVSAPMLTAREIATADLMTA